MPPKYIDPSIKLKAFSCPICGAFADQTWFEVSVDRTKNSIPPRISDEEEISRLEEIKNDPENKIPSDAIDTWISEARTESAGEMSIKKIESVYLENRLVNINVSRCRSCGKLSIWKYNRLLYPNFELAIGPSDDLPDDVRADFEEAGKIVEHSPRGATALLRLCIQKLCIYLGEPGKDLNKDIGSLVGKGLNTRVQKMLDTVRVIGNECVHPGKMDMRDDRDAAIALFNLVNRISYDMITHPREVDELYHSLPPSKLEGIAKRDKKGD